MPITTAEDSLDNNNTKTKTSKQSDRPTKLISTDKVISYTYDSHGRVLFKTIEPRQGNGALKQSSNHLVSYKQSLQFYYNPNNELTQSIKIEQQGAKHTVTITDYHYDAFGRRIHKSSRIDHKDRLHPSGKLLKQAVQTKKSQYQHISYLWDGNRQAQEYTDTHIFTTIYEQNSFAPVARLVWLKDGLNIAANDEPETDEGWYGNNKPEPPPNIQIYHYHNDHLGTPNELTNQQGEVIWLADYEAWGNTAKVVWREEKLEQLKASAYEIQPIRFQGQSFDTETGLHYNRFRYFDPDLGMFTTRDPIGLMGGMNIFKYAPNPTGWIDPWGLAPCKPVKAVDVDAIVKRHGGKRITTDYYQLPSRAIAKQVASEIAGNLGSDSVTIRKSDYRGGPESWKNSSEKIGSSSKPYDNYGNTCSGWRDDSPGHTFYKKVNNKSIIDTFIPPHVNAWNKGGSVNNVHLLYKPGLIINQKAY